MAYERVDWTTEKPINVPNLNKMDEGIADLHNKIGWTNLDTMNGCYRKIGNTVEIKIDRWVGSTPLLFSGYASTIIGSLPAGFNPSITFSTHVYAKTVNGSFPNYLRLDVSSNGTISIFNWSTEVSLEYYGAYIVFNV